MYTAVNTKIFTPTKEALLKLYVVRSWCSNPSTSNIKTHFSGYIVAINKNGTQNLFSLQTCFIFSMDHSGQPLTPRV